MSRYSCFVCPEGDFAEKSLEDACPNCGRAYGFPLLDPPRTIGDYAVVKSLGRGFYGATYVVEKAKGIRTRKVLKVTPRAMYEVFDKKTPFDIECEEHARVSEGAEHVVGIDDMFDADVTFGDCTLPCHVAVLDFLEGRLLDDYLTGKTQLPASSAAQIAADLIRMKAELERGKVNHNDLHASNIVVQKLSPGRQRQGAMDPSIRAVAIDLGSVSSDRRSGGGYTSDLHWIAQHMDRMVDHLLSPRDKTPDLDARVALALRMVAQGMSAGVEKQRTPEAGDLITLIEKEYFRTAEPWRPWLEPLVLRSFNASYNAQTLDAWHVPQLLVDPGNLWQARVGAPGPLVMTGMRGCGKTLLLRALQFHARAARHPPEKTDSEALKRISGDNFVGLFVSAQRLLDVVPGIGVDVQKLFARLFVAYALEASRALAHLADIASDKVTPFGYRSIADSVVTALQPAVAIPTLSSIEQLERFLVGLLARASRSDSDYVLASHPSQAFSDLAATIRGSASIWRGAQILFLLDDVSTRYMAAERVEELLSALIFQSPVCAFKLTSEAQTIFLSLKSPRQLHPAAHGRDFATFDLGAEVHKGLKKKGTRFVEDILRLRAAFYSGHPNSSPSTVLGDVNLEAVAETIAFSNPNSPDRKRAYRGVSALSGVCVGDIGSTIILYENILARSDGRSPVPDHVQNDVFQDFCSRHLYLLDRRGSDLKDVATSFAEAAHELMMQSATSPRERLRQYASIYVRMTTGDLEEQRDRLRELVDAGIFVFAGGAPRTKTRDTNPIHQFKLVFRKLYGLANYIGLSERDRFELSGVTLVEWLRNPGDGKAILMRNLHVEPDGRMPADLPRPKSRPVRLQPLPTRDLFDEAARPESLLQIGPVDASRLPMPSVSGPRADTGEELVDTVVLGLGFEKRAEVSAERLLTISKPARVLAVRYEDAGRSEAIRGLLSDKGVAVEEIRYADLLEKGAGPLGSKVVVDVTGLAKPAIYSLMRNALAGARSVDVAYTAAKTYYPLEADLQPILTATLQSNHHQLLLALKNVLTGEEGPYSLIPLISSDSDGTRMRALYAFASAKHERLVQLAEERAYDLIRVMVASTEGPRSEVARIVAEVAVRGIADGSIETSPSGDLESMVSSITAAYETWYVRGGLNFEIGLTGNKLQTVAAAIVGSAVHFSQVWYVQPKAFHSSRFTEGTGDTVFHRIGVAGAN